MADERGSREQQVYLGNARLPTAASGRSKLVRLLTDPGFAVRALRYALGMPVRMATEDRRVLEALVFPFFRDLPAVRNVLFVGCDWYTKHYWRTFFSAKNYWTLDFNPAARRFGAAQHVQGPLEELTRHFAAGAFDLILCNGVYGFGLDAPAQCESAFQQCHQCLAAGGYFVLGWNDIPARNPVPLANIAALERFRKFDFPPLGTWRYLTETSYRHTYDFYRK